jgi:hypothetical protein
MAWKCLRCGTENEDSGTVCHGMCGYVRFGRLILVSTATGCELRMNLDTTVGKSLLKRTIGEEVRFVSEPQFRVRRCELTTGWLLIPDPKAVNPTCVNGTQAGNKGIKLSNGHEITIGRDKAQMKVRIEL